MASNTLSGWQPTTPTGYARPVQVESATAGLTGAAMPDGRGILVWPNGGRARYAIVSSPADFLVDNVVASGDIGTVVSGSVRTTAVYNIDGQLYVTVVTWTGSVTTTKIYKAADPSNPVSWSAVGTLQVDNTPGSLFGAETWGAGVPTKLASGRWVMGCGGWEVGFGSGAAASGSWVHAYYSDGGAAGPWNRTLLFGHKVSGFPRTDWTASQVAVDPATGDLYFSSKAESANDVTTWRSQNSGGSWTQFDASNGVLGAGAWSLSHVLDDGSDIIAIDGNAFFVGTGTLTNTNKDNGGWTDTGKDWAAPGMSTDRITRKALIVAGQVFTFATDQVARTTAPRWHVGYIGWSG